MPRGLFTGKAPPAGYSKFYGMSKAGCAAAPDAYWTPGPKMVRYIDGVSLSGRCRKSRAGVKRSGRVLTGKYAKCKEYSTSQCKGSRYCSYGADRKGQKCRALPAGKRMHVRYGVSVPVEGKKLKRVVYRRYVKGEARLYTRQMRERQGEKKMVMVPFHGVLKRSA